MPCGRQAASKWTVHRRLSRCAVLVCLLGRKDRRELKSTPWRLRDDGFGLLSGVILRCLHPRVGEWSEMVHKALRPLRYPVTFASLPEAVSEDV
jgi:hypothetical protein